MAIRAVLRVGSAALLRDRSESPIPLGFFQDHERSITDASGQPLSLDDALDYETYQGDGLGYSESGEPNVSVRYVSSARAIKDRLNLMGWDMEYVRHTLAKDLTSELEQLQQIDLFAEARDARASRENELTRFSLGHWLQ